MHDCLREMWEFEGILGILNNSTVTALLILINIPVLDRGAIHLS